MVASLAFNNMLSWLEIVLDSDERKATQVLGHGTPDAQRLAQFLLSDIEAKRNLINEYQIESRAVANSYQQGLVTALMWIASAYQDLPGYRNDWRP